MVCFNSINYIEIRPKWLWMVVVAWVLVVEFHHFCNGCWERERVALLQLKASFNHPNGSFFPDWVENKEDANCCKWGRVECNTNTKRVIKLSLDSTNDRRLEEDHWYLNASLFLPFEELKSLNLGFNNLAGCFEKQGFGVLSSLRNLEHLDLSFNHFNDTILPGLSGLSSLKSLDLSGNTLTGSIDINGFGVLSRLRNLEHLDLSLNNFKDSTLPGLSGLSSLKSLDLSGNSLTGSAHINGLRKLKNLYLEFINFSGSNLLLSLGALPSLKTLSVMDSNFETQVTSQEFGNLTNLEELFLDHAYLSADFLQSIGGLSSLKVLSLAASNQSGILPPQGWCELKNLEELYLNGNNLEGPLPACLGNLSSLRLLDVTANQFTGNIASSPLTKLTLLEYFSLSSNHFQVPVSFGSFMNHSNLKLISCDSNKLIADPTFQTFAPKFQLNYFSLSNCTSKALNAKFPNFLYTQHDLIILDLSYNNFSGMFPSWLLENNTRLEELRLSHNSFTGLLQFPNQPNSNLSTIHISNNNIYGQIPQNMCLIFPYLSRLFMANNGLTSSIPPCFGNMSSLQILELSNNQLSGRVPEQFTSLVFVRLSNNNLGGQISPSVFNSSSLYCLYLDGNNFEGQILDISGIRFPQLSLLDISDNHFSGTLPRWIGNMSDLEEIDFSRNQFDGSIPAEFCEPFYLDFLDLSENNLSGSIPFCFNRTGISHLHLYKSRLSGPFPSAFHNNSNLVTLDLRDNNIIGPIPSWIGTLTSLTVLLLKANNFYGDIPVQLCLLSKLSILDLSDNNFSGPLPSCLSNLTFEGHWKAAVGSYTYVTELESMRKLYFESTRRVTLPVKHVSFEDEHSFPASGVEEVVAFTTKRNSYAYKGDILNFMSGIDLSCNRFTGEIPPELGNLSGIRALNLSHNNLSGSIPTTFSNLKQIESLDLSYNNLNGGIPQQLTALNFLSVFSVAYNNLSGKTPERKAQFGTFDESSYEGNPVLCGLPLLHDNCSKIESPSSSMANDSNGVRDDWGFIDMEVFYVTFGVSYMIVLLGIASVLCINPYWRRKWFYFIEVCIDTCYYFVLDSFHKLCNFR